MNLLVVYYSRTGRTRKVAEAIARGLEADIEAITDNVNRSGPIGYLRSGRDAIFKVAPEIETLKNDPAGYDLIIVGTPIWAMTISAPVRAFLQRYYIKDYAAFLTLSRMGKDSALKAIKDLLRREPIAILALRQADIDQGIFHDAVNDFITSIKIEAKIR
ncbi:MAG TPA: hypothetical protein EYP58_01230 [bacterium (Candidatus Stahlbacteria)]|nr:hypothetical protein [Candidatus Stahlbacteria bacterium]